MLTLKTSHLRAAIKTAAVKDARFYIKGALIERCASGDVHIVSTDGACLFAGVIPAAQVDCSQVGPWRMIVPIEALKTATKTKSPVLTLSALPDGRYMLGDTVFTPVDGAFPDWRRVVSFNPAAPESPSMLDPELMCKAFDAVREWSGTSARQLPYYYTQHGNACARITSDDPTCFAIVMPYRTRDSGVEPFASSSYE